MKSRRLQYLWRWATAPLRPLPGYLIIGAMKAGTTSLHWLLAGHPSVRPPVRKELHYFDIHYPRGPWWYRSHFPLPARRPSGAPVLTGEASPYYLFHERAPLRAARDLPRARLVVLLRDPVARAYSHYQQQVRKGFETLSFAEALDAEEERLRGERARLRGDPHSHSETVRRCSYAARGIYADQLQRWIDAFGRERLHCVHSADFLDDPAATLAGVLRFLDLEPWQPAEFRFRRVERYPDMDPGIRRCLEAFYAPHNRRLYALLGRDFGW